jgi:hypothetical protein
MTKARKKKTISLWQQWASPWYSERKLHETRQCRRHIAAGTSDCMRNGSQVVKSFHYLLTDPPQFDILQSGPDWRGSNAVRSIETTRVHHAARRRGGCVAIRGTRAAE